MSLGFEVCRSCKRRSNFSRVMLVGHWQDPTKSLVHKLKYGGHHVLVDYFSQLMAQVVRSHCNPSEIVLVPVPMYRARLWTRGFNHTELIAVAIAKNLGCDYSNLLTRTRNTQPQFSLGRHLRKKNVEKAFSARIHKLGIIENKIPVLVDDVVATGSTLEECARELKDNGANKVWAIVLARA